MTFADLPAGTEVFLDANALIVSMMEAHRLTQLASHDTDFDRVPGVTRYAPA